MEDTKDVGECYWCEEKITEGQEIISDSRDGNKYCGNKCFIEMLKHNDDELDQYVDHLVDTGILSKEQAELEQEEPEDHYWQFD